ncbi:MAG: F0F1 ATP synthase subunit gamma [Lactovum sp.]
MPASLNEIKSKIASTAKTSHITSAMQMVSAAKLQKSEKLSKNYKIYADKVREVTSYLIHNTDASFENPILHPRPIKKTGYLVITSDHGLVGGYNANILKKIVAELKDKDKDDYSLLVLGSVGADYLKNEGIDTAYVMRDLADQPSFEEVRLIISEAVKLYQAEIFDELYVCHNHHINSLTSQVEMKRLLPITIEEEKEKKLESFNDDVDLEPSLNEILDRLLPQYAESMIYGAIMDAKTAEHAAGMTAMQTATDNAHTVIDNLTIQYNRARQAAITQEITEIVAGASAL